jgi:outer membrane protein OmpA-like peptidoglycan-associated protein
MKSFLKTSLLAAAGVMALSGAAFAGVDNRDVVKDSRGNIVNNTFGNCVRTKWDAGHDACTGQQQLGMEARTVYFDFDSAGLTPAARAKLDSLVDIIKNSTEVQSVSIIGYADMIGSSDYNYALSKRRAKAVQDYLATKGYYDTQNTDVRSFGEDVPVSNCAGVKGNELKACLWRDRRVEIELNFYQ